MNREGGQEEEVQHSAAAGKLPWAGRSGTGPTAHEQPHDTARIPVFSSVKWD